MAEVRDAVYSRGTLYAATAGGLLCIDVADGSETTYSLTDGIGGTGIAKLAVDKQNGKLYMGMDGGNITVFDKGQFRVYTDFKSQKDIVFNKLHVYKGTLLIATNEGLGLFSEAGGAIVEPSFRQFGTDTNGYSIKVLVQDKTPVRDVFVRQDTIYALTRLFWAKLKLNWTQPMVRSNSTFNLNDPSLWTTNANQGDFAYRVETAPGEWDTVGYDHFYLQGNAIAGRVCADLFTDDSGAVYAVSYTNDSAWITIINDGFRYDTITAGKIYGFSKDHVGVSAYTSLAVDNRGRFYVGTKGRGLFMPFAPLSQGWFWNGDEQTFSLIRSIAVDQYGNVYANNTDIPGDSWANKEKSMGILKFDGHKWTHIFAGYDPTTIAGMNAFVVDKNNRIFASFCTDTWHHGFISIDNPFLTEETTLGNRTYGPAIWEFRQQFGPVNYMHPSIYMNAPNPEIYSWVTAFTPTALCFDAAGNFYFSQSENEYISGKWTNPGGIRVYRDQSLDGQRSYQGYMVNMTDYSGATGGFKQLCRVDTRNRLQADGHYNSLAVDGAGNIWAIAQGRGDIDAFGLRRELSTRDSLIFDNLSTYKNLCIQSASTKGLPESKRGLQSYLANKTAKKVKTDLYGDIWISTTSGLYYYAEGKDYYPPLSGTKIYSNVDGLWRYFLPDVGINDFDFDSLNNIWIATDEYGVKMLHYATARYPTSAVDVGDVDRSGILIDSYDKSKGLMYDRVFSVAVHRSTGKVFLGFENGLQEFESGVRLTDAVESGYAYPVLCRGVRPVFFNTRVNGASIVVFTLAGELVFQKALPSHQSSCQWDTKNPGGTYVRTGIYIYRFTAPDKQVRTGKLAIIR